MLLRIGTWLAIAAGVALIAAALWFVMNPVFGIGDLQVRDVIAAEVTSRWAVLGVLGALLGNVLLFLNLGIAAKATDAANVAAEAAKEAIDHARSVSALELRPYVQAEEFRILKERKADKVSALQARIFWKNVGQTPARNIKTYVGWADGAPDTDWTKYDFPEHPPWIHDGGQIGPNSTTFTHGYFSIPIEKLAQVWAGERIVIVYGSVEYDGLDKDVRHRTEFAVRIFPDTDPGGPDPEFGSRQLTVHTGADQDCVYRPSRRPTSNRPTRQPPIIMESRKNWSGA